MTTIERHNPDGVSKLRVHLYNHCVRVTNATTTAAANIRSKFRRFRLHSRSARSGSREPGALYSLRSAAASGCRGAA